MSQLELPKIEDLSMSSVNNEEHHKERPTSDAPINTDIDKKSYVHIPGCVVGRLPVCIDELGLTEPGKLYVIPAEPSGYCVIKIEVDGPTVLEKLPVLFGVISNYTDVYSSLAFEIENKKLRFMFANDYYELKSKFRAKFRVPYLDKFGASDEIDMDWLMSKLSDPAYSSDDTSYSLSFEIQADKSMTKRNVVVEGGEIKISA